MNNEDKKQKMKEYNKAYYEKNRDIIIKKASEKITCEFCKRTVIKNNIQKHYVSSICQRIQQRNEFLENRKNQMNKNNIEG